MRVRVHLPLTSDAQNVLVSKAKYTREKRKKRNREKQDKTGRLFNEFIYKKNAIPVSAKKK